MANSPTDSNQVDHLSKLPDDLLLNILSFLPIDRACQTSILSRRFRHLWEASPSLNLICPRGVGIFNVMVDRVLLRRSTSYPLITLCLDLKYYHWVNYNRAASSIASMLKKAHSLRLKHLTIKGFERYGCTSVLRVLFSMDTLKSLSLDDFKAGEFPYEVTLTSLRSLSLKLSSMFLKDTTILNLFLQKLGSLKDLQLSIYSIPKISISSPTITKLKLMIYADYPNLDTVELFLPSLESFDLKTEGHKQSQIHFYGEVPLLKKTVIDFYGVFPNDVGVVHRLLNYISHVEDLALHIEEYWGSKYPTMSILLDPGIDAPNFFNLRHLDVTICFRGHNLKDVVTMFHHSPALESLNLFHEVPRFYNHAKGRKSKWWMSKLPRNYNYVFFRNLHLGDNRKRFMNSISKKLASKKHCSKKRAPN